MIRTATVPDAHNVGDLLESVRADTLPYRQVFDLLGNTLPFTEVAIITSLPRGGLQVVQPAGLSESLVRNYSREMHLHDRLTWQAIARGEPLRAADAWPQGFQTSRYATDFLQANGFAHAAAAPLAAPLLNGYAGAVVLFRDSSLGDFSDDELTQLGQFAKDLDDAISRVRRSRGASDEMDAASARPEWNQFIFDQQLRAQLPQNDPTALDERLRDNILRDARGRFEHMNGQSGVAADRVPLADSRGDLWNFRVVAHPTYPALSDGPVVFFCLAPTCSEWQALRPGDFQADAELARLVPAMKFMREEFHRGPTLVEIARTVHLSPFHFHRRFTELLGITPKHFLLDCQISQAKRDLLAGEKDLATIAKECGFAHQSHFTSRFKQATGLTPTRWRRMAREFANTSDTNA